VQGGDVQSRRRVKHHYVDSVLVHCGDLIAWTFGLRTELAAQITIPSVIRKQVPPLPARLQEFAHS